MSLLDLAGKRGLVVGIANADSIAYGCATAFHASCHSFIRMARLAEPLMKHGGCLLTVTVYGAERVVEHYNFMGPVKAALESAVRYMAAGARAPIILTSRADSVLARMASCAMALVAARRGRVAVP
jgi:enoyl-[acyl-carrier-protein] reductase (NADH)